MFHIVDSEKCSELADVDADTEVLAVGNRAAELCLDWRSQLILKQ